MLRKVEKYEVESEIGHGGMATVFRARDTKLDRLVALKIMHPHLRGAAEARARFRREAQSVARLKHDRVLEIYDYSGEDSDESYIAAELLTGPTLRKWADEHAPIPSEVAACFAIEVCRALGAAHEKGIVHRDVKPENILLHENRELKLTDFGIADMVDSQSMTATGQILGSPGHMAPEQIEGGHADARTDLFALGTVLYFLTTGRLPFTGKNPHQVLKRVVDGDYADPMRFAPAIGAGMAALLKKAMSKRPEDRFASAADMEKALEGLTSALGMADAHEEVAKFLGDPITRTKEINARIVERSLAAGKKAKEAARVADAQDLLGRVLALDEGNAEALALLANIGSARERAERGRQIGGAAAAIVGLLVIVVGASRLFGETDASVTDASDAGVALIAADTIDAATSDASVTIDAGASDGGGATDTGDDALGSLVAVPGHRVAPLAPRHVVFFPDPENVDIVVDDDPARPFGSFNATDLTPGRHRFTFVSNTPCCNDVTFERDVPAGPGDTEIRRSLPSRDAIVNVIANTPADVVVDGVHGRTRSAIFVPITAASRSQTASLTVTAAGYEPAHDEVQLSAGQQSDVQITLVPLPAP